MNAKPFEKKNRILQTHMPSRKYEGSSSPLTPRTRLERILTQRALRKSKKLFNTKEDLRLSASSSSLNELEDLEKAMMDQIDRSEGQKDLPAKQRLLVVSNRLPVCAVRQGNDSWELSVSIGGLVRALLGVNEFETKWIGWPGISVPDEIGQHSLTAALAEQRCIPVFLDEYLEKQYYNGYCNNILWPLFHYLGLPQVDRLATAYSIEKQFEAYKKANKMFADVVFDNYEEGTIVWCHDYHLMFLPQYLKELDPNMKVGWFLHTPFPSSEIQRMLHSRTQLLRSVLAADIVGFHTYDYTRHFVSACARVLGLEGTPDGVEDDGRLTRVSAFPIGIDSDRFIGTLELPEVNSKIEELQEKFGGRKVILGVDRLDIVKGIPHKILAFEEFLEKNEEWHDKVVLLQIAVPSRMDVPEYRKLTSQVHEIVGRINGRFGTLTSVPIHHLDQSLDFYTLCAVYAVTDVALVTSVRDGMNLVSYEFVACQAQKKGVLILSEFAGAAQSLGAGAILVNPWDVNEVADAISYALNMPADERQKRHEQNYLHVTGHTSQEWAATFISELNDSVIEAQLRTRQVPSVFPMEDAVLRYAISKSRLLILGFNATLTESVNCHGERNGTLVRLRPDLKEPLKTICDNPNTSVIVLSGSDRNVLDNNFREYNMWLAAENGMFLRNGTGEWMTAMPENLNMDWADSMKHVFQYFTERTPKSHLEIRETSFVWDYKDADVDFGRLQARDLLQHLWTGSIPNAAIDVVQGDRSVEVRPVNITKGSAIDRILGEVFQNSGIRTPVDYVLCIGHFLMKDEDVFTFFEPGADNAADNARPRTAEARSPGATSEIPEGSGRRSKGGFRKQLSMPILERRNIGDPGWQPKFRDIISTREGGSSLIDLKHENYYSCAVARKRSNARYALPSADDVVRLLERLANYSRS